MAAHDKSGLDLDAFWDDPEHRKVAKKGFKIIFFEPQTGREIKVEEIKEIWNITW
jgi:hypothetical protein